MPLKNKQTKSIFTSENYYNMHRTAELLMETPFYKKTLAENIELKDKIRYLKYTIEFLEMKNKDLQKKLKKRSKKSVKNEEVVYVEIKKEPVETIVIENSEPIKYKIFENITVKNEEEEVIVNAEKEEDIIVDAYAEEDEEEEEEEEVIVDAEEEEVIVDASAEEDEDEDEEVIVDAEEEEEVIVDAEEDEEEEEVIVDAEEDEEEEEVIVDAEEEEEEVDGVYEIVIKGRTYYVSNEVDSFIYQEDENGEISLEVGKFVDSKATFYKK
jgi:hypothetical protein